MINKEHIKKEGIAEIVSIKSSINKGLSLELYEAFPNNLPFPRPLIETTRIQHEEWLSGFVSGEGCFKVRVSNSLTHKLGRSVTLSFQITQHSRDEILMESLITYFGCGILEKDPRGPYLNFSIYKFKDICEKIIPFFQKHKILGNKSEDFEDWCKVAEIIKSRDHLTKAGLDKIQKIKSGGCAE